MAFISQQVQKNLFGQGALALLAPELAQNGWRRVLIVTDSFLCESGVVAAVAGCIEAAGAQFGVYQDVQPNPTIGQVNACRDYAKAIGADCLLSVGGGSAVDTAKAAGILLANGGEVRQYVGTNLSKNPSLPLVVVNTTAGTGSEVTNFYIITDEEKDTKLCIVDDHCLPRVAVNDSELMRTMPPGLTAATGMDALTHSVEAVLSRLANPLSDKDALWSISQIMLYLPRAVENGADMEARDGMAMAASVAGSAFSNSGLGLVHAMAHSLGGMLDLPHGVCNAILLPHVLAFNGADEKAQKRMVKIAGAMGFSTAVSPPRAAGSCVAAVKKLSATVGIPPRLRDLGEIPEEDFALLASHAMQDACMAQNPVQPTARQVEALFRAAY